MGEEGAKSNVKESDKRQKRREWSPKGVMGWADLGAKIDGINSSFFPSLSHSLLFDLTSHFFL